ncbi:hypothetical protein Tco_1327219 [Tanacetum coccineum]
MQSTVSLTPSIHYEDGNPARAYIKQALGSFKDGDRDRDSQSHKGVKASANSDIEYIFTTAQDGITLQDDERLDLADDLMKAQVHNQKITDKPKDYTLTGSVPGQDVASCCAYSVLVKSDTPDRELIITRVLVMSWPDMPYLLYWIRRYGASDFHQRLSSNKAAET